MDRPPITPPYPGARLWFYVHEWRDMAETDYPGLCCSAFTGWTEIFCWPPEDRRPSHFHWYSRGEGDMHDTSRSKWIAFRRPGDHQSYDAHVTAWHVGDAPP